MLFMVVSARCTPDTVYDIHCTLYTMHCTLCTVHTCIHIVKHCAPHCMPIRAFNSAIDRCYVILGVILIITISR